MTAPQANQRIVSAHPGVQKELRDLAHANLRKRRWAEYCPELSQHDGDWPDRGVSEAATHARVGASRADQALGAAIERVPTVTNSTAPRAPGGVRTRAHGAWGAATEANCTNASRPRPFDSNQNLGSHGEITWGDPLTLNPPINSQDL